MDAFLLENAGVQIETREDLGHVVVAARDFDSLYVKIIREAPVLIWESSRCDTYRTFNSYLTEFTRANEATQMSILGMFHPPLDSFNRNMIALGRDAHSYALKHPSLTAQVIHKLLAISNTNCHQYYGEKIESSEGELRQHETIGETGPTRSALFLYGSKIQHSCSPNVSYTSQTSDGALEYKVIRSIKKGEAITFPYIADLYQTPTFLRRQLLLETKEFTCMCERCGAPDFCRVATCPSCEQVKPCAAPTDTTASLTWTCETCGDQDAVRLAEKTLQKWSKQAQDRRSEAPTKPLYRVRNEAVKKLSPTHFIVIQTWGQLARLYASKAAHTEQMESMMQVTMRPLPIPSNEGLSKHQLRQYAATAGLRAIALSECVASNCAGCEPGTFKHTPVYDCATAMFHACMDLVGIPATMRPPYAEEMVARYLAAMRGQFGSDDSDVQVIENKLIGTSAAPLPKLRQCDGCGEDKKTPLLKCGRCKLFSYCTKDCQVRHWKNAHKLHCMPASSASK